MKKKSTLLPDSELRRRAEEKLSKKKEKAATASSTNADIQRLVHELQVHQIELEMQNEELIRSKLELESTLSQYAELYAFAPVGYFTLTRDGSIRRVNLTGAKLLGLELNDLIKRRFHLFVSPQSRKFFSDFLDKVFTSKSRESCEVYLQKDGTTSQLMRIEGICEFQNGQDEMCYAIVSEVSITKQS